VTAVPRLPPAVAGEWREIVGRSGRLGCYVAGEGPLLLLFHSINAAGSVYEVAPIFEEMQGHHRVVAVDLPGFGSSDRSDRRYDVRLYVDAVHDVLDLAAEEHGDAPVDALAVSLSAEFLARAAVERPDRFRTLALVTPTGFQRGASERQGPPGSTREVPGLHTLLARMPWSRGLYRLLTSRPSIRYFLRRTFGARNVPEDLVDYDHRTTHQPGAERAPFAFLSGRLFSRDVRALYESLEMPVWLAHGTRGDFADFSEADWARAQQHWRVEAFDTGALPHFEQPDRFLASYERFLREPPRPGTLS